MPSEFDFQTITQIALNLPQTLLGWLYILLWLFVLGAILRIGGNLYGKATARQWGLTLLFSLLAFVFSIPRFELLGGTLLPVVGQLDGAIAYRPLGFVGVGLAAWFLNPMLVLIVGMAEGLSRALFGSHQLSEIFHYGFVGLGVSLLIQQKIQRIDWDFWRVPPVATTLGRFIIAWPLVFLGTFFLVPRGTPFLPGLDLALSTARPQWIIALLEGLASGFIVWLVQTFSAYQPVRGMTRPPFEQDIRYRQTLQFLLYTIISLILLGTMVSTVGYRSARALIQTQMAHEANQASQNIPNFIGRRQSVLQEWGDDDRLHSGDFASQQESLEDLFRSGTLFRRVVLVNRSGLVLASYPADGEPVVSKTELAALIDVDRLKGPDQALSTDLDGHPVVLSLVAATSPAATDTENADLFLIGRIPDQVLHELVDGLVAGYDGGRGYLADENRLILADTAGVDEAIFLESTDRAVLLNAPSGIDGTFYIEADPLTKQREIRYRTVPDDGHPWSVVTEVPMAIVLQQAYRLVAGVLLVTILSSIVFGWLLARQGNRTGARLQNLLAAVEAIPHREQGQVMIPANITSDDDEIGQLGIAFEGMQRQLDAQMGELNLLLTVSKWVAETQQNIQPGMRKVLKQVVKDTKAAGGRVVITVLGSNPIVVGEGGTSKLMEPFDSQIGELLADNQDVILSGPDAVRLLDPSLAGQLLPFQSALAYPLKGNKHTYGFMWLTWSEPRTFRESERSLIRSLSEQASVMAANWFYLLNLDKRWRELSAVLNATDDPVIVIDGTNRISMVNPAGERELGLENGKAARNRPIADVVAQSELIDLLVGRQSQADADPVTLDSGKTFDVNVSDIRGQRGTEVGRVAVLRDISKMTEINELKSEFVRIASHDLKDPITIVNGFIQMLPFSGELNEKQQEHVDRIQAAMNQMQKLVEDLLNITRLESGLELETMPVEVRDIFGTVTYSLESLAEQAGNRLVVKNDKVPTLLLNHTFAQQAVSNLVSNAIKYAPNSGEIVLNAVEEETEVVISVADKGAGIPLEVQPRLFEKFYRFSRPGLHKKGKSHGLGLSFVELVADRHNGRIWFQSAEGEGTTFFLAFPKPSASQLEQQGQSHMIG